MFTIDLEPVGRRITVGAGINILEAAQKAGVDLVAACGGIGICGTCLVRLAAGKLTKLSLTEEELLTKGQIAQGYRLACQAEPLSDVRLEIPAESLAGAQKIQVEGHESEFRLEPAVIPLDVHLPVPSLEDLRSDFSRVQEAVQQAGYPALVASYACLDQLSEVLRRQDWKARLALRPQGNNTHLAGSFPVTASLLGLAVDLGSTKLAIYLVDLASGATLAKTGVMNPQISYGEDVVSRIAFANRSADNRRLLQTRLIETLNQAAAELCALAGMHPGQIVDAVVVGNTAMHHFFLGLPVEQLGAAPYVPAVSQPLNGQAVELGLHFAPGAMVHTPANIAGYVGGDHTAALLTTRAYPPDHTLVLVDIGTNTEISLIHNGSIASCSTASGPAFEGAHIHDGMRAAPGAIERVHIKGAGVEVATISNALPVGICGSGILQAVAELVQAGVVLETGVLRRGGEGVRLVDGKAEFVLVPSEMTGHGRDIIINRRDVHEIQLAKGAIRAGIEVLLQDAGIPAGEVDDWIIAGAFGTYLDLGSAIRVGMFPNQRLERFHQVGNAAGVGAKEMLLALHKREESRQMASAAKYIELTTDPDFTHKFVQAMMLK